jgi:hypothetical protein
MANDQNRPAQDMQMDAPSNMLQGFNTANPEANIVYKKQTGRPVPPKPKSP